MILRVNRAILVSVLLTCMAASSVMARGIVFDEVLVTNYGAVVFSDNFDDRNIDDWTSKNDAALYSGYKQGASLYLNCHGKMVSHAYHKLSINQPGFVEASAWVWLPPVQEQYNWDTNTTSFTSICLYSGSSSANIQAGVELHPKETGYRIRVSANEPDGKSGGPAATTKSPVLSPGKWVKLTLQLDPQSSHARALLDGREQASIDYRPELFEKINSMSFWGWLGDRESLAETE